MNKKKSVFLLLIVMLLSLVSCTNQTETKQEESQAYTFTDSEGTSVTLSKKPQTVAILFSSYADIWVNAGGNVDVTVGETLERGFAGSDAILVDSGSGHSSIDVETLIAAKPDLVIGTADYDCQCETVAFCRSIGIPAALFRVEHFSDYMKLLRVFCDLTGKEENYTKYGTNVAKRVDDLLKRTTNQNDNCDYLLIRAGSSEKSTKAKTTKEHFACAMLGELGAENIADSDSTLTGTLSLEVILDKSPKYLFVTTMGDEQAAMDYINTLLATDGWRELDCVKNNRVFYLTKDLFHYKPNANWAEAYAYLISIIYPEIDYVKS